MIVKYVSFVAATIVLVSITSGLLFSRYYWGYWVDPPRLAAADRITVIDRFSATRPPESTDKSPTTGLAAFRAAVADYEQDPTFPLARVPAQLAHRGLAPRLDEPVSPFALFESFALLRPETGVANGHGGYRPPHASSYAYFVLGRSGARRLLLLAANGSQVSNDHYPHYEAAFEVQPDGNLRLIENHLFFYDVAGIEGATATTVAIASAVLLLPVALFVYGVLLGMRANRNGPNYAVAADVARFQASVK